MFLCFTLGFYRENILTSLWGVLSSPSNLMLMWSASTQPACRHGRRACHRWFRQSLKPNTILQTGQQPLIYLSISVQHACSECWTQNRYRQILGIVSFALLSEVMLIFKDLAIQNISGKDKLETSISDDKPVKITNALQINPSRENRSVESYVCATYVHYEFR